MTPETRDRPAVPDAEELRRRLVAQLRLGAEAARDWLAGVGPADPPLLLAWVEAGRMLRAVPLPGEDAALVAEAERAAGRALAAVGDSLDLAPEAWRLGGADPADLPERFRRLLGLAALADLLPAGPRGRAGDLVEDAIVEMMAEPEPFLDLVDPARAWTDALEAGPGHPCWPLLDAAHRLELEALAAPAWEEHVKAAFARARRAAIRAALRARLAPLRAWLDRLGATEPQPAAPWLPRRVRGQPVLGMVLADRRRGARPAEVAAVLSAAIAWAEGGGGGGGAEAVLGPVAGGELRLRFDGEEGLVLEWVPLAPGAIPPRSAWVEGGGGGARERSYRPPAAPPRRLLAALEEAGAGRAWRLAPPEGAAWTAVVLETAEGGAVRIPLLPGED